MKPSPSPRWLLIAAAAIAVPLLCLTGRSAEANYDEAKVPRYILPDPLVMADGKPVKTAGDWTRHRRTEILELFREHVYGRRPGRPQGMKFEMRSEHRDALGGRATRKEVRVWFTGSHEGPWMDILLYLPSKHRAPVPAFLGLNFKGNHAVTREADVTLNTHWVPDAPPEGRVGNRATEEARGTEATRWPLETIVERGYAVATVYYGDLEPDHAEGWKQGVRSVFPVDGRRESTVARERITELAPDAWGAIAAWTWGLSRALDYLETDREIDARRVAVLGHSRLGKTALWAGAEDQRFAMVISNDSGEGGAALARRRFGETTSRLNTSFPHWFCGNFKRYSDREDALPVDQHELIALAAPRPVYVASAEKDLWADPHGEFLAAQAAGPVYALFDLPGLGNTGMPGPDQPVGGFIGYHLRTGVHDLTEYDWARYLDFADRHMQKARPR